MKRLVNINLKQWGVITVGMTHNGIRRIPPLVGHPRAIEIFELAFLITFLVRGGGGEMGEVMINETF